MVLIDLLFAFFFALLLAAIFGLAFRSRGPWGSIWLFFLILFLATWAGGVWMTPIGAPVWGAYWVPFLFVAVIFALILSAAAVAVPEEETTVETVDEQRLEQEERATTATLGIFFWVLMVVLIIAIIASYL